jgi:hypothetical protein
MMDTMSELVLKSMNGKGVKVREGMERLSIGVARRLHLQQVKF